MLMAQKIEHDQTTKRVSTKIHVALELRVPLIEERVEPVHFVSDCLHNGLAIDWARVEEYIQKGVVGEVT